MVRSLQGGILGLACLAAVAAASSARGEDPPAKPADAAARARDFALPGEDPLEPFVPLKPRTVEDRAQIEALSRFAAARALESRRSIGEAIALYEEALKESPDSVAILRRLSKLNLALGRTEPAIRFSRQVLAQEPSDTETITRLVSYYANRRNNPAEAESILKDVLANPKLDPKSGGRIVAEFELGRLYSQKLGKAKEAAESFARVVEALDDREANRLSPADLRRVLGGDEAEAYRTFGQVFLEAGKLDLAVKAFEHGMDYDPDDMTLPLLLGQTLLKTGDNPRALILLEEHIKRQPQGTEGYEALAKALKALGREEELTPRLESAAKRDPHNLALQFVLVERYREVGEAEKADALEKTIREARPTPQGYAALAASFLKRKKAEDFLKTIADALRTPGGLDAVQDSIQAAIRDAGFVDQVLDAGLTLLKADPPGLKQVGVTVLGLIANQAGKLEKFLPIQQLETKRNPSPQTYKELLSLLVNLRRNRDAADTLSEMIEKYDAEKTARNLVDLVRLYRMSDQPEAAQKAARDALKVDPNDLDARVQLALVLNQTGQSDEAVTLLKEADAKHPNNPALRSMLGSILVQAGRNDEAIGVFKGLLEQFPNDDEITRTARSNLSIVYVNMGDYAKGEAELEVLLEKNPDEPGVNNDLGYLYAEQGKNLEKAESMIRKAVAEDPENSAYLDSLGWVLFKRGKVKEALPHLEKAVSLLESTTGADATILEHLGDVYFQLQDSAKARKSWEDAEKSALKSKPPDKRLPEIRKKLETLGALNKLPKPATGENP